MHGVGEDVVENSREQPRIRIRDDVGQVARLNDDSPGRCGDSEPGSRILQVLHHRHFSQLEAGRPLLRVHQKDEVFAQRREGGQPILNDEQSFAVLAGGAAARERHVDLARHRRDWRAEFVRRVRRETPVGLQRAVQPIEYLIERLRHLADFILAGRRVESCGEFSFGDARGAAGDASNRRQGRGREPVAERRGHAEPDEPDRREEPRQLRQVRVDLVAKQAHQNGVRMIAHLRAENGYAPMTPANRHRNQRWPPVERGAHLRRRCERRLAAQRRRFQPHSSVGLQDLHELLRVRAFRERSLRHFVQVNVEAVGR